MCTVTYAPKYHNCFLLVSNRDESEKRRDVIFPYEDAHLEAVYPKDVQGGGTWVASSKRGITLCLLNGAFKKHERVLPYRKSRGLLLLEALEYRDCNQFVSSYDFTQIEPFTLVMVYQSASSVKLHEVRWDSQKIHSKELDSTVAHIWSSCTLYKDDVVLKRQKWFKEWFQERDYSIDNLLDFHRNAGEGVADESVFMKRPGVGTISITGIDAQLTETEVYYNDFEELRKFSLIRLNEVSV